MSLTMDGGPADGQVFGCSRAPLLLRVVQAQSGMWDCLDLSDDEPRPTETIHLYELSTRGAGAFICPGGYFTDAGYRHVVSCRFRGRLDATVRARGSWRRFCAAYFGFSLDAEGRRIADVVQLRPRPSASIPKVAS